MIDSQASHKRIIGLDLIRAMAIVMVIMAHSYCLLQRLSATPVAGKLVNLFERPIINLGPIGVELFFVLSGFLIGGILIKIFDISSFVFADVRQFWIRRWFRTLPNYWLILTLNILIFIFVKGNTLHANQFLGYVFLQNFLHTDILNVFPEAWSLSIEEWFYLTLPVVMYVSAAVWKPVNKRRFLLRVFLYYLSVFLLIRVCNAFDPINGRDPDEGIRKIVLFRLDAVMYGVLAAYFNYYRKEAFIRLRKPLFLVSVAGSLVLYFFIVKYELAFRSQHDPVFRFIANAFLYLVIPLLFSLSLPYAAGVRDWNNKWLAGIVRHISKISYSMYLVHFSLFVPWFYNMKCSSTWVCIAQYIVFWVLVICVSSLLYRYFEFPVMQLRDKWKKEK